MRSGRGSDLQQEVGIASKTPKNQQPTRQIANSVEKKIVSAWAPGSVG